MGGESMNRTEQPVNCNSPTYTNEPAVLFSILMVSVLFLSFWTTLSWFCDKFVFKFEEE